MGLEPGGGSGPKGNSMKKKAFQGPAAVAPLKAAAQRQLCSAWELDATPFVGQPVWDDAGSGGGGGVRRG